MTKLEFKPNLADTERRFAAFFQGEMIDRPIVRVTAPLDEGKTPHWVNSQEYYGKVSGDIDALIDRAIAAASNTFYGGEATPVFDPSLGPDEIAVYCGGELGWSENAGGGRIQTNWSKPVVTDWESFLPIKLDEENFLWKRLMEIYRRAAERMEGRMLLSPPDLHTNMDLLAALRGPEDLCADLYDAPEMIDRAMLSARAVFPEIWKAVSAAGRMDASGYGSGFYSKAGGAVLQCDFSCMISPAMFNRWVLPALEEEAEIVKHACYHWDGPGALVHFDALVASKGLHTLSYVPGEGNGDPVNHLDLYKRIQDGGKAVAVWGSPDEIKFMHKTLKPNKTMYITGTKTRGEAEALLKWFVKNT